MESDATSLIRRLEDSIKDCRHGGPSRSDQQTLWFQECCLYVEMCSPIDALISQNSMMMGTSVSDSDVQIRMALIMTINSLVGGSRGMKLALSEIGSKKFFASLAVDAWVNEDYENVRKFIVKSIIFEHLQHAGAQRVLANINQPPEQQDRYSILERVKGAIQCHNAGLKDILEYCTDGSCTCIQLSQTINEEKELLLNPNADRRAIEARRKEREVEKLPPILKPYSEYWTIKKKAASHLRKGDLGESSQLYLAAKTMLENERNLNPQIHEKERSMKLGEEIGRIASNLSMICLQKKKQQKHKALKYADEAVCCCPGWSKAYCRRALALKSLRRYDEAQVAIYSAIKKVSPSDASTERQLREYQEIKKEIEEELGMLSSSGNAIQQESHPVENPLFKSWKSELVKKEVGTIGCFSGNDDIMKLMYSYLTPLDVANLERTCKRFATNVESGRRIVIGNRLLAGIKSSEKLTSAVAVKSSLVKYINAVDDSQTMALQKFVSEVHPMIDDYLWQGFSHVKMDPLSFETILVAAFPTSSAESMRRLYEMIDLEFGSIRDFQMAKLILRGEANACRSIQNILVQQVGALLDDDGGYDEDEDKHNFSRRFFQNSLDLEFMRLAVSIEDDYDELKQMAYVFLNNAILVKGGRRKQQINPNDPLYTLNMNFHSLYAEIIPDEYPGLIDKSFSWKTDTIDKASIKESWNDATFYRIWKMTLLKSVEWVRQVEKEGLVSDFLLVSRIMQGNINSDSIQSPINCFSLGPFLVMKSVEFGGAVSMSVRLRSEEDLTDFFYDYFSFLKLYGAGYPALVEFNERTLAEHYSYMG